MVKTNYLWDEVSDNVIAEYESGAATAVYTQEPGLHGNLISQRRSGVSHFYHFDARGDTRNLTDTSENVTDSKSYDAWGNVFASTGSTVTPFQFIGKTGIQRDSMTTFYVRSMEYSPGIGRPTNMRQGDSTLVNPYSGHSLLLRFMIMGGVASPRFSHAARYAPPRRQQRVKDPAGEEGRRGRNEKGPICAIVMKDHGGVVPPIWIDEAERAGDVVLPGVDNPQEVLDFVRKHKCCSLYTVGHRGGDQNPGGTVTFPDPDNPEEPVKIFPHEEMEAVLRELFLDNCEFCVINIYACNELIPAEEERERRKEIAERTNCRVCGSVGMVQPPDPRAPYPHHTVGDPSGDGTVITWPHSCEEPRGGPPVDF